MQKYSDVVLSAAGTPVAGAVITVTTYPDGAAATIYAADGGPTVASVTTNSSGRFSFYAASGHYNLTVTGTGFDPVTDNDRILYDPSDDRVSVKQFGAKCDGATDDSAAVARAQSFAGMRPLMFPAPTYIGTPTTITSPIVDTVAQIFTANSQVTIANGLPVRPEWFGSHPYRAAQALPALGGIVELRSVTYGACGFSYNGTYMDVANVTFRGARMPRLADDCKSLTGGTVIQGTFLVFADNVAIENVGIDSGYTYTGAASPNDALSCTYPSDALKTAAALRKGLRLHNVIGLAKSPSDPVHAAIIGEGYVNVRTTGDLVGMYGIHGVVIKCKQVRAGVLTAYCNNSDGVIIKSDAQATAIVQDVLIEAIESHGAGPAGLSPYVTATGVGYGVFLHAYANNISKVSIGTINESGHARGLHAQFDGSYIMDNIQIGRITTDGVSSDAGIYLVASAAGTSFQRFQIGEAITRNASSGMVVVNVDSSAVEVETLHAVNCSNAALAVSSNANPIIDKVIAENCGAAYQITGSAHPRIGVTMLTGTSTVYFQSAGGGQVPALANSWIQVSGNDAFNVMLQGYGIALQGYVSPGSSNILAVLPQFARPPLNKRFLALGYGGSGQGAIPVTIDSSGNVRVNEIAGGYANCVNGLSLEGLNYQVFT